MPTAINVKGITILHNPTKKKGFQFFENAEIRIFLKKQINKRGMQANSTLIIAKVSGS